jgi:hypothetical protein
MVVASPLIFILLMRMKKHLPTLCRQEIMKRVMRMSARTKKGMMLRENECDLLM